MQKQEINNTIYLYIKVYKPLKEKTLHKLLQTLSRIPETEHIDVQVLYALF